MPRGEATPCVHPQSAGWRICCRMVCEEKTKHEERVTKKERKITYVTGISPQSTILSPELNGLTSSGTLYPPYKVKRRDPARIPAEKQILVNIYILKQTRYIYLVQNVHQVDN